MGRHAGRLAGRQVRRWLGVFVIRFAATVAGAAAWAQASGYPSTKPVASVLLPDWAARLAAARDAALSDRGFAAVGEIVSEEQAAVDRLRRSSDRALADVAEGTQAERDAALAALGYDDSVHAIVSRTEDALTARLGAAAAARFRMWLAGVWEREVAARGLAAAARPGFMGYTVFVTQYIGVTTEEVAVPDKYGKFASRNWQHHQGYEGQDYQLALDYNGKAVDSIRVWDVGPWNIDDNYWDPVVSWPRPRRLFTDLARGMPEAQAAYYNGYNGGKDQSGRTVLNPAGCDETPAVAAKLGLVYLQNAWIAVTYWWEREPVAVPGDRARR